MVMVKGTGNHSSLIERSDRMDFIDSLRSKKPEKPIFHYTSQSGLLGIVRDKNIWATNIHYLNDATELSYALDLARSELRKEKEETVDTTEAAFLDEMDKSIEDLKSARATPIFVCSFSEHYDQLSQWRGYCPNGIGFAIGFEYHHLELPMERQGFFLTPCVYDHESQLTIIKELIAAGLRNFRSHQAASPLGTPVGDIAQVSADSFAIIGPILKHPSFSEEKEWRMISYPVTLPNHPQIRYREGESVIIPYFEFKLAEEDEELEILGVVIGPNPHMELSYNSVFGLLRSMNVEYYLEGMSKIPYRQL